MHNTDVKHRGDGAVWCLKTTAVAVAVSVTEPTLHPIQISPLSLASEN